ncbi:MAG: DNA-directed RNA polymerase subunit beta' [Halothece sp.]
MLIPKQGYKLRLDEKGNRSEKKNKKVFSFHFFLKAFGLSDDEIKESLGAENYQEIIDPETDQLTQEEVVLNWYQWHKKLNSTQGISSTEAQEEFDSHYKNNNHYNWGKVGRYKLNKKLEHTSGSDLQLTKSDLFGIVDYFLKVKRGELVEDDMNHLGNRRLRSVGEIIQEEVKAGLRSCKYNLFKPEKEKKEEDRFKKLKDKISKFFKSSELCQLMEQTNPLAQLALRRRVTSLGNGVTEHNQVLREIYPSHYGRLCPIETPEGKKAGLTNALAWYAQVNEFGFITTPYFEVDDEGKVLRDRAPVYLTADEEDKYYLATADIPTNEDDQIEVAEVPVRYQQEFRTVPREQVDYIAVSPLQFASVSTSLIPFLEHDDGTRALMGANMQRQALPLLESERPLVGTGLEESLARASGGLIMSRTEGVVDYVDASVVRIKVKAEDQSEKIIEYPLQKYQPSNQKTYLHQRPIVTIGEEVVPGQVLAEASGIEQGELALGKNVLVAYMPWEGYNYEDAIVISDRLVQDDVYTSIHLTTYDLEEYTQNEYGKREEITREIPGISDEDRANLDEQGIIYEGAWVEPGDILVGKVSPISTPREREGVDQLLHHIFGDDMDNVRDKSLRVPKSVRGRVIHVEVFSLEQGDELPEKTNKLVRCYIAQARKIKVGDKLAGRHGNKGIVSRILPQADMPFLPDGRPIDIVLNPLGVPSRMNVGQIFECLLGFAGETLKSESPFKVSPFDEMYGEERSHDTVEEKLKQAATRLGKEWIYNQNHPQQLKIYDGRTGEPFDRPVTVGQAYMLKLSHLADDKIQARSTGPYNPVTQQPVRGKAQNGGQRFGDMEVWALEGYGAAYTLQELLTLKSDDMEGRKKAGKAIMRGNPLPTPNRPEAFNVLRRELQALGLDLSVKEDSNNANQVSEVTIGLASPDRVKSWGRSKLLNDQIIEGEITDHRTYFNGNINQDGLLSEEIFGALSNQQDRRQRMGYINLATPVVHVWYQKTLATLLNMDKEKLKEIIYCNSYVVINPPQAEDSDYELLSQKEEDETRELGIGGEAILRLLQQLDLQKEKEKIQQKLEDNQGDQKKLEKRLRVINSFISTQSSPEWMLLTKLPVLPPDLRPVITLEGGVRSSSDLNQLYEYIIRSNNRLVKMQETGIIPEIILNNEKRSLQYRIDNLLSNEDSREVKTDKNKRPLKSLTGIIKGKEGRFRGNLLGKRVDYSGRSIIIIGPHLKIDQCGLPKKMAIELFRPFVIAQLMQQENNGIETIEDAKRKLNHPDAEVWKILEAVVQNHPVLLNRQPTLHRLGVQAFKPVLVEGEAIQLHPLVCPGFNADFDGDTMAVHVPLSPEAKAEAWRLMLGNNNLLSPATGEAIVTPSQDIVLGCYYLTAENPQVKAQDNYYSDLDDALRAYEQGYLNIHTYIWVRFEGKVEDSKDSTEVKEEHCEDGTVIKWYHNLRVRETASGEIISQYIRTTPGRIIYNQIFNVLNPDPKIFRNHLVGKKQLKEVIKWAFGEYGNIQCAVLVDKIKDIGFRYATQSGISICLKDLKLPPEIKQGWLEKGEQDEKQEENQLTEDRKIKIWDDISENIVKFDINNYFEGNDPLNSIYIMSKSGARGSMSQVRQLVGMRGIIANSQGEKISLPVKKNFQEGLSVSDYLISSYGTRKGVVDTALKTADSGYLGRRLVTAARDVVVREEDCETKEGIELTSLEDEEEISSSLQDRLVGRTLAKDVVDPETKEVIAERNQEVDEALAEKMGEKVESVSVRSPLTCKASGGVCQRCYGWSLAHHKQVSLGEAVGVIAAQSISEPTTQMTLRTFHTGGAAEKKGDIVQGLPRLKKLLEPPNKHNSFCLLAKDCGPVEIDNQGKKTVIKINSVKQGSINPEECLVENGDEIKEIGTPLTKGLINPKDLLDRRFEYHLSKEDDRYQATLSSFHEVQQFLIEEIQKVYKDQNIDVADKHIEVIVSQMTSKVEIEDGGNSNWLPGDQVKLEHLKDDSIRYKPVLLGLTEVGLKADSFLSAASFQRTKDILTEAARQQKIDCLQGLKENSIVGNIIPAGTGFNPDY